MEFHEVTVRCTGGKFGGRRTECACYLLAVLLAAAAGGCTLKRPWDSQSTSEPGVAVASSEKHAVEHIGQETFDQQVLRSSAPVMVDFYATWCGPCQQLGPVLEQFAAETPGMKVVKVDIDQNRALADRYGVQKIPCVIVFKDGKPAGRNVGLASKAQLKAMAQ